MLLWVLRGSLWSLCDVFRRLVAWFLELRFRVSEFLLVIVGWAALVWIWRTFLRCDGILIFGCLVFTVCHLLARVWLCGGPLGMLLREVVLCRWVSIMTMDIWL